MAKPSHVSAVPVQQTRTGVSERYKQSLYSEALDVADSVVRYFSKRRLPVDENDVRSEAFLIAVSSLDTYDPAKGPPQPLMFDAARVGVSMAIGRWLSPTTVSDSALKRGVRPRAARDVRRPSDEGDEPVNPVELLACTRFRPDELFDMRQIGEARRLARQRYEDALRRLVASEFERPVARALAAVLGVARGRQLSVEDAARRGRITEPELRREYARLRRLIYGSAQLGAMRREMGDQEESP